MGDMAPPSKIYSSLLVRVARIETRRMFQSKSVVNIANLNDVQASEEKLNEPMQ